MQTPEPRQAAIIPFPARPAAATADQARLAVALAKLLRALDEQKIAVGAWRASLAELKSSVEQLGDSTAAYRANLADLALGVKHLNREANTLVQISGAF